MITQLCPDADDALAHMLDTARNEIDRHLNENGTCAWCANPWPCDAACRAEFALSAF
jgi:hypothetical protein